MSFKYLDDQIWEDELRWTEVYSRLPSKGSLHNEHIIALQQSIIDTRDVALAYLFALNVPYRTYLMQDIVLHSSDPTYIVLFAKHIPYADIKSLQARTIQLGKPEWMFVFAYHVAEANRKTLERAIIKSGSAKWCHMALKYLPGSSYTAFRDPILGSRCPTYLLELARRCGGDKRLLKAIETILVEDKQAKHCRLFAKEIPGANIKRLEQAVLESENLTEIKRFATQVKESKLNRLSVLF